MMKIGGLQKLTLIDFPGKVACTVFLSGCNFRCPFCYSPELVLPEKIKEHPDISEKDFFNFLKERKNLLEGVTICGGEPTRDKKLPGFIKKIKKMGFFVKLDTNGSNPEMLGKLIDKKIVDYFAMDIKAPLGVKAQNYEGATGVKADLDKIKKSIGIIKNSGVDYEFRTTVVPSIHTREDIIQIVKDILPAKRYYLQAFLPEKTLNPAFEKIRPYSRDFLLEIQKAVSPFFEICQVR
ncbi:MAG: anaerobic ribonucleoside-triphosphate reductase activating protein [Candidatus Nealsonbacteria bacterium]|nr:anaerobic ribonucleoside-triphosphate reductase activating protein [Candidatus Nealsonbacteria bacterium]